MTTQAERPVQPIAADPPHRRWPWGAVAAAVAIVIVGTGVTVGIVATRPQHPSLMPPKAVLGQSLQPLAVYQRLPIPPRPGRDRAGQMTVAKLGQPGDSDVLRTTPVTYLHVQYAHVRPVLGHWQIEFIAPASDMQRAQAAGRNFDVLLDGKAQSLFPVTGSFDGTNFAIGVQANWLTSTPAVAVAKSLTTSVTVAHCSQAAIEANYCP